MVSKLEVSPLEIKKKKIEKDKNNFLPSWDNISNIEGCRLVRKEQIMCRCFYFTS